MQDTKDTIDCRGCLVTRYNDDCDMKDLPCPCKTCLVKTMCNIVDNIECEAFGHFYYNVYDRDLREVMKDAAGKL